MQTATGRVDSSKSESGVKDARLPSPALEWVWQYLRDDKKPVILDCGRVRWASVNVLIRRNAKVYVGDAISPVLNNNPKFWDRSGKVPVFLTSQFLAEFPKIVPGTLTAIFCWHLLDLLPRPPLPAVVDALYSYLKPGGVLFCLLREPYLQRGADEVWWLETLTGLGTARFRDRPFPYPVLTTREVEKLLPFSKLKVFLVRSGRRELLALK